MIEKYYCTWEEFYRGIGTLINSIQPDHYKAVCGVPRGGVPVSLVIGAKLNLPQVGVDEACAREREVLVCDDIIDSGATRSKFPNNDFIVIHARENMVNQVTAFASTVGSQWVVYPWESSKINGPEDAVIRLLQFIGEDPTRQGLVETPRRFIKAYNYMFSGYKKDPTEVVKTFDCVEYDQIVLLKDIEMYSTCEHHMLPFFGKAHIAYVPNGKVIGVSKLARLLDIFCRRLQIQERIGTQITTTLMEQLEPLGAACIIEATHLCMRMRGVEKQNSVMTTSSLKGVFIEQSARGQSARSELMRLVKSGG